MVKKAVIYFERISDDEIRRIIRACEIELKRRASNGYVWAKYNDPKGLRKE